MELKIAMAFRLIKLIIVALKEVGINNITLLLKEAIRKNKHSNSLFELEKVAGYTGIPSDVIKVKTRKREIVEARQVAMYLSRKNTKESLATIGRTLGNKDHATVLHACKTVENLFATNRQFRDKWMPLLVDNNN